MRGLYGHILMLFVTILCVASCSTTKVLQDGQYRLASNKVAVDSKSFNSNEARLESYIKQKTTAWSPFLYVYNWSNGKGKAWDRFVQKIGVAPVVYDAEQVEMSEKNIATRLEYLGYYDSKVEASVKVRKRRVYVTYNVDLGRQLPIVDFTWDVPSGEFKKAFDLDTANISIRPGMMLSENACNIESNRSSSVLRNDGFYGFSSNQFYFEADTLGMHDSVKLHMSIKEFARDETPKDAKPLCQYRINKVSISHPAGLKFREDVLRNLNTIHPGDVYSETAVSNTYSRLGALRVFNNVGIEMTPVDSNLVDCNITLSQSKLQGFKVNLEGSVNSTGLFGVSPQISYYHKNIFHGGEWLNLSFMGNFQFKFRNSDVHSTEFGVSAGLSLPEFLGLPSRIFVGPNVPRTDINLSYNYQNRPEYQRNIISASYGYSASFKKFFYQIYPLNVSVVRLNKLDEEFYNALASDPFMRNSYTNHFDFGSAGTFYFTTNTDSNPQTSFFYTRFQLNHAGNLISAFNKVMKSNEDGFRTVWGIPYSQYVRGELTVGKTWRFGRKDGQAIATRLVAGAGYAYGNSESLPFERLFYAGGANSLRGWQARSVGPGRAILDNAFKIPNQAGDLRFEANVEYRFNIVWKLEGATFIDAGNVWNIKDIGSQERPETLTGGPFFKSVAANWGVGMRINLNFIVLRLDWGMKIHDPSREDGSMWVSPGQWVKRDGYAVHFGVGYPF